METTILISAKRILVAGIGTGVGKTVASAVLVEKTGAAYWKPVQTGTVEGTDTDTVRKLVSRKDVHFYPEKYTYEPPVSPHLAAQFAGEEIDTAGLRPPDTQGSLVIEFAGGVCSPLTLKSLNADWAASLDDCCAVLVTTHYLGSLNHTVEAYEALVSRGIHVAAWISSGEENAHSHAFLLNYLPVPFAGHIPLMQPVTPEKVKEAAHGIHISLSTRSGSDLLLRDQKVIWHPYTQEKNALPVLPVVRAKGAYLFLEDGTSLLDGISSWWVNPFGHNHPHIVSRLREMTGKLDQVIFAGFTHQPAVELAENLLSLFGGGMQRVFFSDDGSTAVEVAVKMALQYWHNRGENRTKILALENSYHGDTFGAMSVSGRSIFNAAFQDKLFEAVFLPSPVPGNGEMAHAALLREIEKGGIAAIIYEPLVQGAGGMVMHDKSQLDMLLKTCRSHGILMIADEVMTGFGRVDIPFASAGMKISPDIVTLSKGITGGLLALGATLCTAEIYQAFLSDDKKKTLFHGHSYTANPLACTAGVAACELLRDPQELKKIRSLMQAQQGFAKQMAPSPHFRNARSCGTIFAAELDAGEQGHYLHSLRDRIYNWFLGEGILLRPLGNTIYVMPPYCIEEKDLAYIYDRITALPGALGLSS